MEEGDILSIVDPQMGKYPSKKLLEPLLKLALACCQSESEARPRMVDIVRELEDIRQMTMSSDAGAIKECKDPPGTFSIDLCHAGSKYSGEPSDSSLQGVSSYDMVDSTGQLKGKIDPR